MAPKPKPKQTKRLPLKEPELRPTFRRERRWLNSGIFPIAGCDEAGRGPLAGPVVAAAVILDPARIPRGLNDSKKLTAIQREALYEKIMLAGEVSVAAASPALFAQLSGKFGIQMAALMVSIVFPIGILIIWLGPETKGKPLPE